MYNWKSKYGGLTVSDAHRLKELETEQALDNQMLKEIVSKKS